jgi:hypothetical protein
MGKFIMKITISKSKVQKSESAVEKRMLEFEYDLLKGLQLRQKALEPKKFRVDKDVSKK